MLLFCNNDGKTFLSITLCYGFWRFLLPPVTFYQATGLCSGVFFFTQDIQIHTVYTNHMSNGVKKSSIDSSSHVLLYWCGQWRYGFSCPDWQGGCVSSLELLLSGPWSAPLTWADQPLLDREKLSRTYLFTFVSSFHQQTCGDTIHLFQSHFFFNYQYIRYSLRLLHLRFLCLSIFLLFEYWIKLFVAHWVLVCFLILFVS